MSKKTSFKPVDPKQNFVELEKEILNNWEKDGILKKYLERNNKSQNKFRFLDGPITANNPMGVHHAWGRTLKDLWQRFYNMKGYRQRFQNGFDEQGLWIEVEVEKELGLKNKQDIENLIPGDKFASIAKFVNLCKERVKKFSQVQTGQSKRLGYFMDWDNSYHTSSPQNNYAIWNFLKVCYQKGYLYKGRDSVPWCPRCGTAISQHEILTEEYQEIIHKAVFVKYKVISSDEYLLVWTTTPWTLPSNIAIAISPNLNYGQFTINGSSYIIETTRAKIIGIKDKPKKKFKGKELIGRKYQGNFDELPALNGVEYKIVGSQDLVTAEEGTGLVHIAPGAGEEDFRLAKEENLSVVESIDETAAYIEGFGDLTGKNAKVDPDLIIDKLKEKDVLFKVENYKHRYPTCWRCKTELVWRVVDEWFIAMDHPSKDALDGKSKKTLREQMIDVARSINWIPKFGLDRELDWLNNMHDWLISKKRYWGLALPIWECTSCGNFEVIGSKNELKQKAVEGWEKFNGNTPHRPWIDEIRIYCEKCGEKVSRISDVGNVWLDAGIVPFSTMPTGWFPADFITESFPGQFKNWFYSLIAMSTVLKNTAPFKNLLGHGLVRDEKGEEMHKSKGNSVEFNEAADKIGVDVMRWLYLRTKPEHNVNFGYHVADKIRRLFILPLWNSYSFFVTYAQINNWQHSEKTPLSEHVLDKWIISRLNGNIENITNALDGLRTRRFDAWDAIGNAEIFISDLSNWYIRRIRDRVNPASSTKEDINRALNTLWKVLVVFSKALAPMTPFLSETIYQNLTSNESVHLAKWPKYDERLHDKEKLEAQMKLAREIAEMTHAKRKKESIKVRQPLSSLTVTSSIVLDNEIKEIIAQEVNVEKVEIKKGKTLSVKLDTKITSLLKTKGEVREIIRQIQQGRKEAGCQLTEKVMVKLPDWPKEYEEMIKKETLTSRLIKSPKLEIVRTN